MKRFLSFSVIFLLCAFSYRFCESKTDGFTVSKISATVAPDPEWEVSAALPDPNIFHQKFRYLNFGGQSYVFLSEDGRYVLKFFKNYLYFPKTLSKKKTARAKGKMQRDFRSYKLAYNELLNESKLIYLHLNPTDKLLPKITIIDKLGIEHQIALDDKRFALQHKAELLYPYLNALMEQGEVDSAKNALSSLLTLLKARLSKGIYDEDAKLHRNCGFIDQNALFIDIGRFCKSSKPQTLEEMTARLSLWLKDNHPELEEYLENEIKSS